ncbi:MAG: leucine-rich repeat domain-containing protein [Clostridiales bacterium]|nr:leucine-rich repeat domain-containing protein [Clostridiales bacterium]
MKRTLLFVLTMMLLLAAAAAFAQQETPAFASLEEAEAVILQESPASLDIRGLAFEDVKYLVDTYPEVDFHYTIRLGNIDVDSQATEASLDRKYAKKPKMQDLMERLAYLPNLTKLDMFNHRYPTEELAVLHDSYPNIRFGFVFVMEKWTLRTDITAFSTLSPKKRYTQEDFLPLRFCHDLLGLDLGHNAIDDLSFLELFPNLRVLILADNRITDVTPIAQLQDLEYLELFQNDLTDLSPLAANQRLIDLNVCWNPELTDYETVLKLPRLERIWLANTAISPEGQQALRDAFPEAKVVFKADHSTSGWRTHDRYFIIRDMFFSKKYKPFAGSDPLP